MTTLMSSTNKALPKISYVKSIDVFLGTCFVMVFAALLEYATVGYLAKRIQMRKNHFAALQKMALQLQTAREEHFQQQQRQQQAANEAIRNFHIGRNNFSQQQHASTSFRNQPPQQQQYNTLGAGGMSGSRGMIGPPSQQQVGGGFGCHGVFLNYLDGVF
jgi:hypothetical protein